MKVKHVYLLVTILGLFISQGNAQQVGINEDGAAPHPNAILDVRSLNKGMLIPRMSSANRLAISPTTGLLVYDTTTQLFWYNTGLAWQNIAIGAGWSLNGNSGNKATNFLGTIDDVPLRIKVKNEPAGLVDQFNGNTFWGFNSGGAVQASGNTATGFRALANNVTGNANTATGITAMQGNTAGSGNTATGNDALAGNRTGSENTAVGIQALSFSNNGERNTGIGAFANISQSNIINTTVIGFGAFASTSNKVRIGNSAITSIEGAVPFTTPSDKRFKYSVQDDVKGLDFILQLRPVTYQFDVKRFDQQLRGGLQDPRLAALDNEMDAGYNEAAAIRRSGFIAQEVEQAAKLAGYNFNGLQKPKTAQEHYSLSYESFVVPLVKGMQELHLRLEKVEKENAALKQELLRMQRSR